MKKLILKSLSESENAIYKGMKDEIVSVTGVGVAVHDGVKDGGTVLREPTAVNDNILRNGNFTVTQNGTVFTGNSGSATYTIDGWFIAHNGGSTSNIAKLDKGVRVTCLSGGLASSFSRFVQTAGLPAALSGKTVTLSFRAKSSQGLSISSECFITGGGVKYLDRFDLTTQFETYTVTFEVPNYTESSVATDSFKLSFWLEAGDDWNTRTGGILAQDNTVDFEFIKLEYGSAATENTYNQLEEARKVKTHFEKNEPTLVPVLMQNISIFGSTNADVYTTINYAEPKWKSVTPTITTEHTSSSAVYSVGLSNFSVLGVWNETSGSARVTGWTCDAEILP